MEKFRYGFGVIIGTLSAMMLIFLFETIDSKMFQHENAYVSELLIFAIASYIGGLIAALISGREINWPSIVTGILLFGVGLWNGIKNICPAWFISGFLACIPFAWYGYYSVRKNKTNNKLYS